MKSKTYGRFTVLIPEKENALIKDQASSFSPVTRKTVYQVRVDDEAYLEFSMEKLNTPRGNDLSVTAFARKNGNPKRAMIGSVFESKFKSLGIVPSKDLSDETIMQIYEFIMQDEERFWTFYCENFENNEGTGNINGQ